MLFLFMMVADVAWSRLRAGVKASMVELLSVMFEIAPGWQVPHGSRISMRV